MFLLFYCFCQLLTVPFDLYRSNDLVFLHFHFGLMADTPHIAPFFVTVCFSVAFLFALSKVHKTLHNLSNKVSKHTTDYCTTNPNIFYKYTVYFKCSILYNGTKQDFLFHQLFSIALSQVCVYFPLVALP